MSELRELYQQLILDHNKSPRHYGRLADANRHSEGHNPLCGDRLQVFVRLEGDVIRDLSFEGSGCAISRASASLLMEALKGKSVTQADRLLAAYHRMLTSPPDAEVDRDSLGKLAVFAGVRAFPMRVKCATLPWHTVRAALAGDGTPVSTE